MNKVILIKYGEINTKKANRNKFVKSLVNNINNKLNSYEYELEYAIDHMFIITNNIEDITNILKNISGIHSIIMAYQIDSSIETILDASLNILNDKQFKTFKIQTKRGNKSFPLTSIEVSHKVGSHILRSINNIKVDVKEPEVLLNIEIKEKHTYLYIDKIKGIGGFPTSNENKAILMLSGGIDSPVAGYMALKRGLDIECIYFESPPHTSLQALNKVKELVRILTKYKSNIKLHIVPFTKLQEEIYKNANSNYMVTLLRRMMYRITEEVAIKNNDLAIVNGECIGQVASQTLASMNCINSVINIPVIRPLACFDKEEIISIAKEIGTYETSILPYEDCCTIFVPKHPVINPSIDMCLKQESKINYEVLIQEAIDNINTITINYDDKEEYEGLL